GAAGPVAPAGVKADMVPLSQMLSDYSRRHPDKRAAAIVLQNVYDTNATATIRSGTGVTRGAYVTEDYDATTGEWLPKPSTVSAGSVSGDVQQVFLALHEGRFSPIALRWLYFLTGLAGAAMIASGAVLWVRKRRQAYEAELKRFAKKRSDADEAQAPKIGKGVIFVERMNVATIIGLPIGVAAYFLANRLIPVGLEERGSLEADAMFIAWALTFVVAVIRPHARIWSELMWLACAAYAAIPFVNALTTNRHLGVSLPAGDWMMAGFDLTMLAIAALFGLAAQRSAAKQGAVRPAQKPVFQEPVLDPAE
ncbi:MAG: PepSY-associated TM helix domain-containing protein, partial [Pseudomonadota bacterium]